MTKSKAFIITLILFILLALCLICAWALEFRTPVYIVLGLMAIQGGVVGAYKVFAWIRADAPTRLPLEPPITTVLTDDTLSLDYESIRDEIRGPRRNKVSPNEQGMTAAPSASSADTSVCTGQEQARAVEDAGPYESGEARA